MQAALIVGKERVDLVDVPDPVPGPGGIVVDIDLCGICGTDVHAYASGSAYNPAICGHEWTGVVSAVAADAVGVAEGDRVVTAVPPACGSCGACLAGQARWCGTVFQVAAGVDRHAPPHGGFAPRLAVHAGRVVPADPRLTVEQAAQVEPTTVAYHAVRHTAPEPGDLAVIQGAGPIGLTTLQLVAAAGAGTTLVVEPNPARRALATELGATHVVDPAEAPGVAIELSGGLGADVVYECVGRPGAIQDAVDRARRGGRVCLIGLTEEPATITPPRWLYKEITVTASLAYTHDDFRRAMAMIVDGRVRLDPLHSSTVDLAGLDGALADLAGGGSAETKVLVRP